MPTQTVIEFAVYPRPESSGIRIASTDPVGLFVSCSDRETAYQLFEFGMLELAVEKELVDRHPGQQFANKIDWEEVGKSSQGVAVVVLSTEQEIKDVKKLGHGIHQSKTDKGILERFTNLNGDYLIVGRDNSDMVDGEWIIEQLAKAVAVK